MVKTGPFQLVHLQYHMELYLCQKTVNVNPLPHKMEYIILFME